MPLRLDSRSPDFQARFRDFLNIKREASQDVEDTVRAIIADVAARGDRALVELPRKFDRVDLRSTRPSAPATARPSTRLRSRVTGSKPTTGGRSRRIRTSPTRSASNWVRAGPRSKPSGSTCLEALLPIRHPF
jgi:histidinol dehydrogenase